MVQSRIENMYNLNLNLDEKIVDEVIVAVKEILPNDEGLILQQFRAWQNVPLHTNYRGDQHK